MNLFYTHQKCLLTLAYQVEVINYISKNKMFLQKIMLSI